MPIIQANGVDLHYLQVGQGPDLIMLHGIGGNLAAWHLGMVPLLQDHFRLTTYDLRGHGNSSMPPSGYTTRHMADDLAALMDALQIPHADLMGHSYGADVSLHFALCYPERVRRLVLLEPGIPALLTGQSGRNWAGWIHWAELLEHFSGQPVPEDRRTDIRDLVRRSIEIPAVFGPARGLPRRRDRTLDLVDTTTLLDDYEVVGALTLENLATLPHPKLVACEHGSGWMSTFVILRDVLTNCTSVTLPESDLRHFGPLNAPEALVSHLMRFLETGVAPVATPPGLLPLMESVPAGELQEQNSRMPGI